MLSVAIDKFYAQFDRIMRFAGESVCIVALFLAKTGLALLLRAFLFLWDKSKSVRTFILNFLKYAAVVVVSPFLKVHTSFEKIADAVSKTRKEKGFFSAIRVFLSQFLIFLFGKNGFAVTFFNYAAPVISIVFLINIISYSTGINYAVKLEVNGQFLGYIEKELVFNEAQTIIEERLNSLGSFKQIDIEPVFSIEKVGYAEPLTKYQVADLILMNSDINVSYAYGVMVDGELIGAVEDNTRIKAVLESLLAKYKTGAADEEVRFELDINCDQTGQYITESIIDEDIIIDSFSRMKEPARYYTVAEDDSHESIAEYLDVSEEELEKMNPGFLESDLAEGQLIKYGEAVPQLSVCVTRTEVYEIEVPYEVEYRDDATLYADTERVYRQGEVGRRTVTARVTRTNGVVTERSEQKSVYDSLPVTQIILKGTKPSPEDTYSNENAAFGKFIWPVSRDVGYISELTQWDGGYPGHTGVDIAAKYGTPIYAGASGTVVMSQSYYDYGLCIIIEHSNGLRTYYAHCSKLYVKVGDVVTQGQCIGLVGMTGRVTGPHVHFEVRDGNRILNPIHYLD